MASEEEIGVQTRMQKSKANQQVTSGSHSKTSTPIHDTEVSKTPLKQSNKYEKSAKKTEVKRTRSSSKKTPVSSVSDFFKTLEKLCSSQLANESKLQHDKFGNFHSTSAHCSPTSVGPVYRPSESETNGITCNLETSNISRVTCSASINMITTSTPNVQASMEMHSHLQMRYHNSEKAINAAHGQSMSLSVNFSVVISNYPVKIEPRTVKSPIQINGQEFSTGM